MIKFITDEGYVGYRGPYPFTQAAQISIVERATSSDPYSKYSLARLDAIQKVKADIVAKRYDLSMEEVDCLGQTNNTLLNTVGKQLYSAAEINDEECNINFSILGRTFGMSEDQIIYFDQKMDDWYGDIWAFMIKECVI